MQTHEDRTRGRGSSPEPWGSLPEAWGSSPWAWGSSPEAWRSSPEPWEVSPEPWGGGPRAWGSSPETRGDLPHVRGGLPEAWVRWHGHLARGSCTHNLERYAVQRGPSASDLRQGTGYRTPRRLRPPCGGVKWAFRSIGALPQTPLHRPAKPAAVQPPAGVTIVARACRTRDIGRGSRGGHTRKHDKGRCGGGAVGKWRMPVQRAA
jgi:hypothetical protein